MKKSFFFTAVFLLFAMLGNCQLLPSASSATTKPSIIKNGTVYYTMSVEGDDPQAKLLNNSTLEFAFSGKDSKMAGLVMGGLFSGNLIMDGTANNGLALMSVMGQKKSIRMTPADVSKAQTSATNMNNVKITPIAGTQKIAGYLCKKVMITDPKNPEAKTVVYVCNNIAPESGGLMDEMMKKLSGFPLGFEVSSNGSKIKILASEVSTKIPKKADFKQVVPEGYEETTMEKLREQFGGTEGE
jgi:hypothetical protein